MTALETYKLRARAGFTTPIKPIERGKPWTVANNDTHIEWMMHPDDAFEALALGVTVNGAQHKATSVGVWPFINAIQVAVTLPEHGREARIT